MELTRNQIRDILFGLRVARNQVLVGAWDGYWNDIKRIDVGIHAAEEYERQRPRGRSPEKTAAQPASEMNDEHSCGEKV